MVVAQEQRAARIGVEILDRGGNAVDAAVAVGFALAVTYPRAGNIGGGGFMVIHLAKATTISPSTIARPRRPRRRQTMFLDAQGKPTRRNRATARSSVGVPGTVAGLALAHAKYGSGKLTLADLIAPAIDSRSNGFRSRTISPIRFRRRSERLARWPATSGDFFQRRRVAGRKATG